MEQDQSGFYSHCQRLGLVPQLFSQDQGALVTWNVHQDETDDVSVWYWLFIMRITSLNLLPPTAILLLYNPGRRVEALAVIEFVLCLA